MVVVVLVVLINVVWVVGKDLILLWVVVGGVGVVGVVIMKILLWVGVCDVVVCDICGVIELGCFDLVVYKCKLVVMMNLWGVIGSFSDVLVGVDVYIGVSGGMVFEVVLVYMVECVVIFGLVNFDFEVYFEVVVCYVEVVVMGCSDFFN